MELISNMPIRYKLVCASCNKIFYVNAFFKNKKHCSVECKKILSKLFGPKRMVIKICAQCDKEFYVLPHRSDALYCCKKCSHDARYTYDWKEFIICPCCGKKFRRNRKNQIYCDMDCFLIHIENENKCERKKHKYRTWTNKIHKKDNYTCCICGFVGKGLVDAHHIFHYANFPELRYKLCNGITLCKQCHMFHHTIIPQVLKSLLPFLSLAASNQMAVT